MTSPEEPPGLPCATCGNPDAIDYAGQRICIPCYSEAGACCMDAEDEPVEGLEAMRAKEKK